MYNFFSCTNGCCPNATNASEACFCNSVSSTNSNRVLNSSILNILRISDVANNQAESTTASGSNNGAAIGGGVGGAFFFFMACCGCGLCLFFLGPSKTSPS